MVCLAACAWFVAVGEARAQAANTLTLAEYHERVGDAALAVDALLYPDEEEGTSAADRSSEERAVVDYVRDEIASVETVVWDEKRFDLSNDQLTRRLDVYEENTGREPVGRRAVLRALAEHLRALDERLAEVLSASAIDADAAKGRLARRSARLTSLSCANSASVASCSSRIIRRTVTISKPCAVAWHCADRWIF